MPFRGSQLEMEELYWDSGLWFPAASAAPGTTVAPSMGEPFPSRLEPPTQVDLEGAALQETELL